MTQKYDQGLKVRRQVVGDAYVDRSVGDVSDFMRPMQELVTEYCWGDVWMRPGLAAGPQHRQFESVDGAQPAERAAAARPWRGQ